MNIQLKDVDKVKFNGIDISAVKFNTVLVWRKWETIEYTGVVPVTITAAGEPLIDLIISGNMNQSGVPSPTTPIQPQECGERTGNLYIYPYTHALGLSGSGSNRTVATTTTKRSSVIRLKPNTTYTIHGRFSEADDVYGRIALFNAEPQVGSVSTNFYYSSGNDVYVFTTGADETWGIVTTSSAADIDKQLDRQLVEGNYTTETMPAYSPYGYKLPFSSGGENLFDENWLTNGYHLSPETGLPVENQRRVGSLTPINVTAIDRLILSYTTTGNDNIKAMYSVIADDGTLVRRTTNVPTREGLNTSGGSKLYIAFYDSLSSATTITTDNISEIMLNLGSTAKAYTPYNRTTTPIYLGEVETTRKIKKVVFTGQEEDWRIHPSIPSWFQFYISEPIVSGLELCTHYKPSPFAPATIQNGEILVNFDGGIIYRVIIRDTTYTTLDDFKSYLAQQYANGTPVTVWYVLATEQTGILNEPIRKIGDYADSISAEQAQVQIPTVSGANVVDINTTLKPSSIYLKYKGKS